ncbi:murein biosynthesis integral membrane protein MurJ [Streptomyces axinellae]|uniref:Murein biosynthesis integral membrane protein MurJ n=1 Tax=Streptomyces axinellae TaxID=552788 RepID=A0ABP6CAQ0_9ACTN
MNAPYGGDRGRTPGDGPGRPEDLYEQDPYGQRPPEDRDRAPGVPYGEDSSTVQFTGGPRDPRGDEGDDPAWQPYGQQPYGARPPHAQHQEPAPHPQASRPPQVPQPHQPPQQGQHPQHDSHAPQAPQAAQPPQAPQAGPQPGDAFAHLYRDQGHQAQNPEPPRPAQFSQQPPQPQHRGQGGHGGHEAHPEQREHQHQHHQFQPAQPPYQASPQTAPPQPYPPEPGAPGAAEEPSAQTVNLGTVPSRTGEAAPAEVSGGGGGGGLLKSSAIMAAGTMVSRLTGFIKSALIVAALGGVGLLGDSYQLAITLPTMIYILTVGGGLNSVFVPQLVRAMKEDDDGGQAFANRLLTLVTVILGALAALAVVAAPLLVRVMSYPIANNPQADDVAVAFVRYCVPSIFFMGIHVVMGQILNARGRFGAMMWTPVLNNIVIIAGIGMFIWVYGVSGESRLTVATIPPEGVRLLGASTLLGLVVQALAMFPYLRAVGFRIRPRFDWRGHGLGKSARLAKWTTLFVLANQAGVLVVSNLSTAVAAKGGDSGSYLAYSNAQLIWSMPQSIITVSVMAALLPRLSRSAAEGDSGTVRDDISQGLRNSAVAIVPIAFGFLALGIPMCTLIYGSSGLDSARSVGYMLMAFGIGLIPYSVQYVVLRAFYAYEDTRTPFFNTVIVAAVNAAACATCYLVLPTNWAVVGMAASYGLAYIIGVGIAWRRLRDRLGGDLDGRRVVRTYIRLAGASVPATLLAGGAAYGITHALGSGTFGSVAALAGGGIVLGAVFVLAAKRMRIEEMTAMLGMVRARLGR